MSKSNLIPIRAFVAPYNSRNTWGELFKRGSFSAWVKDRTRSGLVTMRFMHEEPIGIWNKFWDDSTGIWAEGFMIKPTDGEKLLANYREISVSWAIPSRYDYEADRDQRYCGLKKNGHPKYAPFDVTAKMDPLFGEVSIVNHGAFKGTHWERI